MNDLLDFLANVPQPIAFVAIGVFCVLLGLGVNVFGLHPDPEKHPTSPKILTVIGSVLLVIGVAGFAGPFVIDLMERAKQEEIRDKLAAAEKQLNELKVGIRRRDTKIQSLVRDLQDEQTKSERVEGMLAGREQDNTSLRESTGKYQVQVEQLTEQLKQHESREANLANSIKKFKGESDQLRDSNDALQSRVAELQGKLDESLARILALENQLQALAGTSTDEQTKQEKDRTKESNTQAVFNQIYQQAGDYVALFLYQNPKEFFDYPAVIGHIAYAISSDLNFLAENIAIPKTLKDKVYDLLKGYASYDYVDGKEITTGGITILWYFRLTSKGRAVFASRYEQYEKDQGNAGFLALLSAPSLSSPREGEPERAANPGRE